jgi:hypothetical protein
VEEKERSSEAKMRKLGRKGSQVQAQRPKHLATPSANLDFHIRQFRKDYPTYLKAT